MFITGQVIIILLVLLLPLLVHRVEKNLETFLFVMGVLSATISHFSGPEHVWSLHLVEEALVEPIKITLAVCIAGFLFKRFRQSITKSIAHSEALLGPHVFAFFFIVGLGLLSSIITAIIAALVLVEIINALPLDRKFETRLTIIACFAIGLGAALTPVGEPLSTIATAKLKGPPYHADFFFLFKHLWFLIIPGVVVFGIIGAFLRAQQQNVNTQSKVLQEETTKDILLRTGKVYLFVMALIFLGAGFRPVIDAYIVPLGDIALYWINTVSAVLDNATLASAEISPKMKLDQIQFALMGLLISGGMLIPGNIPNIIAASKLDIKSKQWAKFGLPVGFAVLVIYFIAMLIFILA
ncbi:MAG TPA: DUF1646 family protein [bacterium]|nr:DUF1646 family protein [bacterium]HPO51612.1 DUF1646 family protein [bacterium]